MDIYEERCVKIENTVTDLDKCEVNFIIDATARWVVGLRATNKRFIASIYRKAFGLYFGHIFHFKMHLV